MRSFDRPTARGFDEVADALRTIDAVFGRLEAGKLPDLGIDRVSDLFAEVVNERAPQFADRLLEARLPEKEMFAFHENVGRERLAGRKTFVSPAPMIAQEISDRFVVEAAQNKAHAPELAADLPLDAGIFKRIRDLKDDLGRDASQRSEVRRENMTALVTEPRKHRTLFDFVADLGQHDAPAVRFRYGAAVKHINAEGPPEGGGSDGKAFQKRFCSGHEDLLKNESEDPARTDFAPLPGRKGSAPRG